MPQEPRSLNEKQKDKKDVQCEEARKIENSIRGSEDVAVGFLEVTDEAKIDAERKDQIETNDEFQIFVKMFDGKTNRLFVKSTYKTIKVIRMLETVLDEDELVVNARLSYGSTPMNNELPLSYYNIRPESTLFINGRMIGGGIDGGKFFRLSNLFISTIKGHPNYVNLMDQINKLSICETVDALNDYDGIYPLHRL